MLLPEIRDACRDEEDGEFLQTKEILDELGVNDFTIEDCKNVRKICKAVSERAAYLASAGSEFCCCCFIFHSFYGQL